MRCLSALQMLFNVYLRVFGYIVWKINLLCEKWLVDYLSAIIWHDPDLQGKRSLFCIRLWFIWKLNQRESAKVEAPGSHYQSSKREPKTDAASWAESEGSIFTSCLYLSLHLTRCLLLNIQSGKASDLSQSQRLAWPPSTSPRTCTAIRCQRWNQVGASSL